MNAVPLPSRVHYELLLQVLERETQVALKPGSAEMRQAQELIVSLRKAVSLQKQLEASLERQQVAIDYRWSVDRAKDPTQDPTG